MTQQLKVWWKPQIPCASFEVPVKTIEEAKLLLRTLALYDIFQFEHRIKPDYCNAGGLLVLDEIYGWIDWEDDDGLSIDHVMRKERTL
jgi:hypothetical protein